MKSGTRPYVASTSPNKTTEPLHRREQQEYRPERNERIEQGRRVFGNVEHRKRGHYIVGLHAPGMRIAIEICCAQEQEKRNDREPEHCELPLALGSGFQKE